MKTRLTGNSSETISVDQSKMQLLASCKNGNFKAVRTLLSENPNIGLDMFGCTLLHYAVKYNRPEVLKICMLYDMDLNAVDKIGRTPLQLAAYYGYNECISFLLSHNVGIDLVDNINMTALHRAAENGFIHSVILLITAGANPFIQNKCGKCAHQTAKDMGHNVIATILEGYCNITSRSLSVEQRTRILKSMLECTLPPSFNIEDSNLLTGDEYDDDNESILSNNSCSSTESPIREDLMDELEKEFGLNYSSMDEESTMIERALKNGQTLVLTEAGKLALQKTNRDVFRHIASMHGQDQESIHPAKRVKLSDTSVNEDVVNKEDSASVSIDSISSAYTSSSTSSTPRSDAVEKDDNATTNSDKNQSLALQPFKSPSSGIMSGVHALFESCGNKKNLQRNVEKLFRVAMNIADSDTTGNDDQSQFPCSTESFCKKKLFKSSAGNTNVSSNLQYFPSSKATSSPARISNKNSQSEIAVDRWKFSCGTTKISPVISFDNDVLNTANAEKFSSAKVFKPASTNSLNTNCGPVTKTNTKISATINVSNTSLKINRDGPYTTIDIPLTMTETPTSLASKNCNKPAAHFGTKMSEEAEQKRANNAKGNNGTSNNIRTLGADKESATVNNSEVSRKRTKIVHVKKVRKADANSVTRGVTAGQSEPSTKIKVSNKSSNSGRVDIDDYRNGKCAGGISNAKDDNYSFQDRVIEKNRSKRDIICGSACGKNSVRIKGINDAACNILENEEDLAGCVIEISDDDLSSSAAVVDTSTSLLRSHHTCKSFPLLNKRCRSSTTCPHNSRTSSSSSQQCSDPRTAPPKAANLCGRSHLNCNTTVINNDCACNCISHNNNYNNSCVVPRMRRSDKKLRKRSTLTVVKKVLIKDQGVQTEDDVVSVSDMNKKIQKLQADIVVKEREASLYKTQLCNVMKMLKEKYNIHFKV